MAPTTPHPGTADPLAPRLDERVADAFAEYAAALDRAFPAEPGGTGVAAAYASYAAEVARVFHVPDVAGRAWELSVDWYRALRGTPPGSSARYDDLVAAAVDVGLGQQKVLEAYQALVAAVLHATERGDAAALERAYDGWAAAVRRAWSEADPAGLTPTVVLATGQGILAATGLHGVALQAVRRGGQATVPSAPDVAAATAPATPPGPAG